MKHNEWWDRREREIGLKWGVKDPVEMRQTFLAKSGWEDILDGWLEIEIEWVSEWVVSEFEVGVWTSDSGFTGHPGSRQSDLDVSIRSGHRFLYRAPPLYRYIPELLYVFKSRWPNTFWHEINLLRRLMTVFTYSLVTRISTQTIVPTSSSTFNFIKSPSHHHHTIHTSLGLSTGSSGMNLPIWTAITLSLCIPSAISRGLLAIDYGARQSLHLLSPFNPFFSFDSN